MTAMQARRFVVLLHEVGGSQHWDFCLEAEDALATWQIERDPLTWAQCVSCEPLHARRLPDHRKAYLTYEGPVSGNRGKVRRVANGRYLPIEICPDRWIFELEGSQLSGRFELTSEGGDAGEPIWLLQRLAR
jgi:hypothetical protein